MPNAGGVDPRSLNISLRQVRENSSIKSKPYGHGFCKPGVRH
nr:MAG TPA: hypothetical protein [Caudoviricetes sp.]DAY78937.1 MAG TPA: hypothetical protein [Caudoviricetes sp.]